MVGKKLLMCVAIVAPTAAVFAMMWYYPFDLGEGLGAGMAPQAVRTALSKRLIDWEVKELSTSTDSEDRKFENLIVDAAVTEAGRSYLLRLIFVDRELESVSVCGKRTLEEWRDTLGIKRVSATSKRDVQLFRALEYSRPTRIYYDNDRGCLSRDVVIR